MTKLHISFIIEQDKAEHILNAIADSITDITRLRIGSEEPITNEGHQFDQILREHLNRKTPEVVLTTESGPRESKPKRFHHVKREPEYSFMHNGRNIHYQNSVIQKCILRSLHESPTSTRTLNELKLALEAEGWNGGGVSGGLHYLVLQKKVKRDENKNVILV